MIKFRFHRGGLKESMATQIEVENIEDIVEAIEAKSTHNVVETIRLEYYVYDERIDWDTYLVLVKYEGVDFEVPVGMTNGKFSKENEQKTVR